MVFGVVTAVKIRTEHVWFCDTVVFSRWLAVTVGDILFHICRVVVVAYFN
jgi:hypothetical protein